MKEITAEYLASQGLSENFPERFWCKIRKTDTCWLWVASLGTDGYGLIGIGYRARTITAHRASWILNKGPIPVGVQVLHDCVPGPDNPACVRPDHLWLVTNDDNMADKARKGHARKKLNPDQIIEIRALLSKGITMREIASIFEVCPATVWKILHGVNWSHI